MLDQLIQTAQQQLGTQLQQIGVKPEQLGSIFNVAQQTVTDGLKSEATSGGLNSVMNLFNGNGGNLQTNPIVSSMSATFIASLAGKLGINQSVATKIAGLVIPVIMQKFSSSETGVASSPADLISKLGLGDITSALGNMSGGNNKSGDLLSDLGNLF